MKKKILNIISKALLILSLLILTLFIISNLIIIIRIMFFGMQVGNEYPDSIWWGKVTLKGLSGIKTYYQTIKIYIYEIPISIICLIYQIIYYKIIKKKLKDDVTHLVDTY